ncbi:MAG: carboxypeptidase-like regulatory domain-containing protein, partial [Bacteroidia bacterium]|nr:carboxypeptidase-like regulatory domain-containing protein [Bacteroidia bacterium]
MKLSIHNPCSENWNNMLPNETGRFCNSCQKSVVDFSKFSDGQLLEFFTKKDPEQNVCGNVRIDQLNRNVVISKPVPNFYNRWLALAFGFFTMIKTSNAQTETKKDESGLIVQNKNTPLTIHSTGSEGISGIVIDEKTKEPLPFVRIEIAGTTSGTITDTEGRFKLGADFFREKKQVKLVIRYIGYEIKEIELPSGKLITPISLKAQDIYLEEVKVISVVDRTTV